MKRARDSLGRRFFMRMLALILAIGLLTFGSIDILLRVYIHASVSAQLYTMVNGLIPIAPEERPELLPDELLGLGMMGNAFLVSPGGEVLEILQGDPSTVNAIAAAMLEQRLIRADTHNAFVSTQWGDFRVSSIADQLHIGDYMVFFVDVTTVVRFYRAVNLALLAALGVAGLVSVILARRFSNGLEENVRLLTNYTARIGGRDFDAARPAFGERELDDLSRAMERTAEELRETQDLQTAFFQNISHELRTPLMSIRCYAEGIACGVMDAKESCETILEETDQLSAMVEDLLYISRMDRDAMKRHMETVDLRDTLSECASALRRQAQRRQIGFDFQFVEEPVWFTCDPHEMAQMVTNLLTNAIRYARSEITLECRAENGEILLAVSDDGEGLSDADLPHIFERFFKGRGGQHGVGLSIVQSIVAFYGGTISANNRNGARFEIRLPAR